MKARTSDTNERRLRIESWRVPVTIRLATAEDRSAIATLAARDTAPPPPGRCIVAEREGRIDVAICLETGAVIADPFMRTAELVELLRCHAGTPARSRPSNGLRRALPGASRRPLRPGLAGGARC